MQGKLSTYHAKRNFNITTEPKGEIAVPSDQLRFVVQKHAARKLHYDFRLEFGGTLKSWAVPKGPSLDPAVKRLAVEVEDHPLDYIDFEGEIPAHQYGAGHVEVWDTGFWQPVEEPSDAYRAGKIKFHLQGEKLHGGWTLVRTRSQAGDKAQWLLIKEKDETARPQADFDITAQMPDSVLAADPQQSHQAAVAKIPPSTSTAAPRNNSSAMPSSLPDMLRPQLATLVDAIPTQGKWEYEIKLDGYRVLAKIAAGQVQLFTRDGKDWSAKLPHLITALSEFGLQDAWLDGEIVVLDKQGVPSFQLLQNAFQEKSSAPILYFLFDVPYLNGVDLRPLTLAQRRPVLQELLAQQQDVPLRYSAPLDQPPQQLLDSACRLHMEGIIGKRADSIYTEKRSKDWIKLKCDRRQEFIIAGYTDPQGTRKFLGALLLAVHDDDDVLRYAGRVGTGFDSKTLHTLYRQLTPLAQEACPFISPPGTLNKSGVHWVKPQLVAEISFAEWTNDGLLRHAVFQGLRLDKPAAQIRRERPVDLDLAAVELAGTNGHSATPAKTHASGKSRTLVLQDIKITHPERVVDTSSGLTKGDVAQYYAQIAASILPYLHDRPVYLLRAPEGIGGETFFQKHSKQIPIPGMRMLDPALDPKHEPLMVIDTAHALVGAAQMGTIELHTCNATADDIAHPDCMVFDLDPDPALAWSAVVQAAKLTKVLLDELGLKCFLKTSGGKGLHLVVPLARRHPWKLVSDFSQAVAAHLAHTIPTHFSARMGAQNRVGKVFVDYLRNQKAASTVAPYSLRARPGLPVATPIGWEELDALTSASMWTLRSLPARLADLSADPWHGYADTRQIISPDMQQKIGLSP